MDFKAGEFDIAVIGAGHAGIEAALAAARLGCSVVCFTINMDAVGNMPCNPAIGGTGVFPPGNTGLPPSGATGGTGISLWFPLLFSIIPNS